jgi:hypothetical protein
MLERVTLKIEKKKGDNFNMRVREIVFNNGR